MCCVLRVPLSCWKHFSGCFHPFFVDLRHFLIIHLKTKHKPKKDKIWVPVQEVNPGCWPALRVDKNIFFLFSDAKMTFKNVKSTKKTFKWQKIILTNPLVHAPRSLSQYKTTVTFVEQIALSFWRDGAVEGSTAMTSRFMTFLMSLSLFLSNNFLWLTPYCLFVLMK